MSHESQNALKALEYASYLALELKYYLQILFADQASTHKYEAFMQELDTQAEEARRLAASTGGINSDEEFAVYKGQVDELLTLLQDYVWQILKEEE